MADLDPKQKQGALLDAMGHSIAQMVAVLKVSESTVSRWRRLPEYSKEVERIERNHRAELESKLALVQEGIVATSIEATTALRGALDAIDPETGGPDWETRLEAIRITKLEYKDVYAKPAAAEDQQQSAIPAGGLTIVVGQPLPGEDSKVSVRPNYFDGEAQVVDSTAAELPAGG